VYLQSWYIFLIGSQFLPSSGAKFIPLSYLYVFMGAFLCVGVVVSTGWEMSSVGPEVLLSGHTRLIRLHRDDSLCMCGVFTGWFIPCLSRLLEYFGDCILQLADISGTS